jgi:hypothetical protein
MNIRVEFDSKESDPKRLHDQAFRFCQAIKEQGFDVEVAGLLHLFVKACGVTQEDLDSIYRS